MKPPAILTAQDVCAWTIMAGAFVAVVVAVVVLLAVQSTASTAKRRTAAVLRMDRRANPRIISRQHARHGMARTQCVAGEVYDSEVGMCAPIFKAPLALESSIMDTVHHTPCSSMYGYMCGKWIDQHTNENRAFTYAYMKNQARLRGLIASPAQPGSGGTSSPYGALRRFYTSCLSPVLKETQLEWKHLIEVISAPVRVHADLPAAFGRLARYGFTAPFVLSIERHPTRNATIPLFASDNFPATLDEGRMYQLMVDARDVNQYSVVDQQQRIQAVLRITRALREHDTQPLAGITDYFGYVDTQLERDVVRFDALEWRGWPLYFQALDGTGLRFHHDQHVWVIGMPYFQWLLRGSAEGAIGSFTIAEWRAWIEFSILYNTAAGYEPDLPSDVYYRQHDKRGPLGPGGRLYNRVARDGEGSSNNTTPDSRCLRITQAMLPGLTAEAFLRTYYTDRASTRHTLLKLVARIMATFKRTVLATTWLSDTDKQRIAIKMDATQVRVVEPDDWSPEPFGDSIANDRWLHNVGLVRRYRVQRNLALWRRDATEDFFDRSALAMFAMPLTEANAYYSGSTNSFVVLAGLLQPPFYSPLYDDVTLYAIMGSIIGHEASHMLDSHGLYWDENGSLRTAGILSPQGMATFFTRTDCVVREYGPAPLGCEDANANYGNSTIAEDLADLTGTALAYHSLFVPDSPLPLSARQHFWMVAAQTWCASYDQEHLCEAVQYDEHSVPEFRVDRTFRNLQDFIRDMSCHDVNASNVCAVY